MTVPPALLWFKRDLRLLDHTPLTAATRFERDRLQAWSEGRIGYPMHGSRKNGLPFMATTKRRTRAALDGQG